MPQEPDKTRERHESDPGVDPRLARHGRLSYLEIPALDPDRSAAFYETVLGWKVDRRGSDDLRFSDATGELIGRWVTGRAAAREPGVLPYIYVDGIEGVVELVTKSGGEVVRPLYPEGNVWVTTVRDPAGNVIGLWEEARR